VLSQAEMRLEVLKLLLLSKKMQVGWWTLPTPRLLTPQALLSPHTLPCESALGCCCVRSDCPINSSRVLGACFINTPHCPLCASQQITLPCIPKSWCETAPFVVR
jgi:hypothetical protein